MIKKVFYLGVIFCLSHYLNAQVGIGTDKPKAALDVVPKNSEDPLKLKGLEEVQSSSDLLSVDDQGVVKKTRLSTIKGEIGRGEGVKGILIDVKHKLGTDPIKIQSNNTQDIPGVSITYTPVVDCNALVTISALPLSFDRESNIYGTLNLVVNDEEKSLQYFSSRPNPNREIIIGGPPIGTYSIMTTIVTLDAGKSYTFKLEARSWMGEIVFNNNPYDEALKHAVVKGFSSPIGGSYFGVRRGDVDKDKESMKSSMTILFYSR